MKIASLRVGSLRSPFLRKKLDKKPKVNCFCDDTSIPTEVHEGRDDDDATEDLLAREDESSLRDCPDGQGNEADDVSSGFCFKSKKNSSGMRGRIKKITFPIMRLMKLKKPRINLRKKSPVSEPSFVELMEDADQGVVGEEELLLNIEPPSSTEDESVSCTSLQVVEDAVEVDLNRGVGDDLGKAESRGSKNADVIEQNLSFSSWVSPFTSLIYNETSTRSNNADAGVPITTGAVGAQMKNDEVPTATNAATNEPDVWIENALPTSSDQGELCAQVAPLDALLSEKNTASVVDESAAASSEASSLSAQTEPPSPKSCDSSITEKKPLNDNSTTTEAVYSDKQLMAMKKIIKFMSGKIIQKTSVAQEEPTIVKPKGLMPCEDYVLVKSKFKGLMKIKDRKLQKKCKAVRNVEHLFQPREIPFGRTVSDTEVIMLSMEHDDEDVDEAYVLVKPASWHGAEHQFEDSDDDDSCSVVTHISGIDEDGPFVEQSKCGLSDGLHEALLWCGEKMYNVCPEPNDHAKMNVIDTARLGEEAAYVIRDLSRGKL